MHTEKNTSLPRLSRRHVLKWFAAAAASSQMNAFGESAKPKTAAAEGYGQDPILSKIYEPGDFWPLMMSKKQRRAATALADVILPADDFGPSASSLRVHDFIDEWVSAPYPRQEKDRSTILSGLRWLDEESRRRDKKDFADLPESGRHAICDDLCQPKSKEAAWKKAAHFFQRFTELACGAYYGTPEGWKAIGYVGNMPGPAFHGPPQEVLDRLGLVQTVKG